MKYIVAFHTYHNPDMQFETISAETGDMAKRMFEVCGCDVAYVTVDTTWGAALQSI